MKPIKSIIHIHTDYSPDSDISVEYLAEYAAEHDIGCMAITDHDRIEGARRLKEITPCKVIVGEEVSTLDGHLIGLFLTDWIRPKMSALETAIEIKRQGGLVLVPHMYARVFGCGLREVTDTILDYIDAIEVLNAQHLTSLPDQHANRYAKRHGLTRFVGSDSHLPCSIGPCFQMMSDFNTPAEFIDALAHAELNHGYHPWRYLIPMYIRAMRYVVGLSFPAHVGINSIDKQSDTSARVHSPQRI